MRLDLPDGTIEEAPFEVQHATSKPNPGFQVPRMAELVGIITATDPDVRNLSLEGFEILGKEAAPVIPEVVGAMNALNSRGDWPMLILRCLGDTGLSSLMAVITNRANTVAFRECALKYVSWDCTNSAWAVAPLIRCLNEEDWEIVSGAARAIGELAQEPNIAVPVLVASLRHPNRSVRYNAAYSLGRFGTNAQSAAPAIMEMFTDGED